MKTTTTLAAGAAILSLLAGCASGPASGSGADVVETGNGETGSANEGSEGNGSDNGADETDESSHGTRGNPVDIGTTIQMGEWSLSVTDVTLDATDEVMATNEFNESPAEGRQFVLFSVDATYEGEESGTAWLDFSWAIVGAGGNTFGGDSMDDYCGVIPNPLDEAGETFPDGDVSGNVCISAASDQLDGGTIRIEESMSFEDTRAFYALR